MKIQCTKCNSVVEDVSGICPVCGAELKKDVRENRTGPITEKLISAQAAGAGFGQNGSYGQMPYNYQSSGGMTAEKGKKKAGLSIWSLVLAVLSIVTVCFPLFSIICCLAAIVLGIIALVKKQIKVPAILGIVFGGIFFLIGMVCLSISMMLQSVIHTNLIGTMQQCMEAYHTEPISLDETGITIDYPDGSSYYYAFRIQEGYWETCMDAGGNVTVVNGTYQVYNYMTGDNKLQNTIQYEVIAAMSEGYEMKDVTCVVLSDPKTPNLEGDTLIFTEDADYKEKVLVFVFPEDYQMGDTFYLIDMNGINDYELVPINSQIPIEPEE